MADNKPVIYDFAAMQRLRPQAFRTPDEMAQLRLRTGEEVDALLRQRVADHVTRHGSLFHQPHPSALADPPPSFAAYAPDPDADYARGVADGRAAVEAEIAPVHNPHGWTNRDQLVRGLLVVAIPALLFVWLIWLPRS